MQSIIIRQAAIDDIDEITELERVCFSKAEAANKNTLELRLKNFPQTFWVLVNDQKIVCMINGMTTHDCDLCDEMYEDISLYAPDGDWLMLFGVATCPDHRHRGFASRLLDYIIEKIKEQERQGIVLTCKKELVTFYQQYGFRNEGISESVHGGAEWYQMRLTFRDEMLCCIKSGEEYSYYKNGKRFLIYSWEQCDGVYINIEDNNGNIIRQTFSRDRSECSELFITQHSDILL